MPGFSTFAMADKDIINLHFKGVAVTTLGFKFVLLLLFLLGMVCPLCKYFHTPPLILPGSSISNPPYMLLFVLRLLLLSRKTALSNVLYPLLSGAGPHSAIQSAPLIISGVAAALVTLPSRSCRCFIRPSFWCTSSRVQARYPHYAIHECTPFLSVL